MSKVDTSGTWPAISVTPPSLEGLNTDNVKWGVPAGGAGKSGYLFAGGTAEVLLDGTEFTLGTFTHQNFPIQGMPQSEFDVDLAVRVLFEDQVPHDFSFRFHHNETPNVGPSPEDIVDLPTRVSPETVIIDGTEYAVVITGFKMGGQIVTRFISPENGANSADLVAVLARIGRPDVRIANVRFKGEVKRTQADEYVEVVNRGTAPADISGWVLGADDAGQDFTFPAGTVLQPGQRIRIYTNQNHPEWGGFSYGSGRPIWNDKGDAAKLRDTDGNLVSEHRYGSAAATP
ncbi:lamin tail domain-containing protein [Streptomyces iconiensis]|uniref:Lamin tail domain-containing protein n=1 Tax=Streptomyces iconiensis TaxID=1384038 RepID=A0ABT6ZV02_9ACTN|nr:lamin tail domain-containing protein [Streptomyces iconiensis]MDJ1132905.1 lamin tail domain-containing protein [Streptomyces iconiensis]